MKIVVIGGVAAGPKAASKIIRMCPDTDVTVVDKGEFISFAGCGLPYYVSDIVKEQKNCFAHPSVCLAIRLSFKKLKMSVS